jgi:hypothetical protein
MIGDMQEMSVSDASPPPLIAAGEAGSVSAQLWKLFSATPCKKAVRFLSFPYVCPEPVLVKCSFV